MIEPGTVITVDGGWKATVLFVHQSSNRVRIKIYEDKNGNILCKPVKTWIPLSYLTDRTS